MRPRFRLAFWLIIILAPARVPAWGQFTAPYDPDFTPQKKEEPAVISLEEEAPSIMLTGAGPFLLLDRPDKDHIFEQAAQPAEPLDFEAFELGLRPFQYSQAKWNKTRADIEAGIAPTEESLTEYTSLPEFAAPPSETPKPPPPELELPTYGTSLSVTGRKVISFQFSEKRYLYPQITTNRPATTGLFDITQQLQLRMQGKVGPKIAVNVDYDDTKLNKQDISVVYQGDSNEVVQNVSFGDIDLSLPATEFVSYNKQLFGIRADIKYQGLKATFIGSRTKGTTKIKQFYGNNQFVSTDILDTGYSRRQYYDLAFGNSARLPIRSGSERVYLAQQNPAVNNVNQVTLTVDDLAVKTSSFTGNFILQSPGQDYTVDFAKGILFFRNQLQAQYVVAVDYIDANGNSITVQSTTSFSGGTGLLKLIKTPSDLPIAVSSETGYNRELKTFYNIGQTQIVRDNGRGNFILRVMDKNRNEVGPSLLPQQKYPETISVDFENGIFQLLQPFSVSNDSPTTVDPDIYSPTPISKRIIHLEYNYRFKTFFLEPSLVAQSDVVILDGSKLVRNVDYFIDYDAGFITFFNPDRIRSDSSISIAYEVSPFLGISNESLLGTRVSYDFNKHVSMGSTLLYQAGAKNPSVPNITELARSLLVYDVDTQVKSVKLLSNLTMNFSGEFAQSRQNLNLNAFALIDNMEGIKQDDSAPVFATSWRIASNPGAIPTDPTKINWFSEDVKVLDINPRATASPEETQKVLGLGYDFSSAASTEASIVFPFSVSGLDFSQKNILEVVMLGDNSNNEINFHLGGINEDADGSGVLKTEDVNGDGILQADEDIGWLYSPVGKPSARYGAGNGLIDSDDLNQNGRLDPADFTGDDFGYKANPATNNDKLFNATDSSTHTFIDFGTDKWRTFQIPLNITANNLSAWTAIKQIRISVRKRAAGGVGPSAIKFARVGAVGNTWLRGSAGDPSTGQGQIGTESLVATPVNSVDNPSYVPIYNAGGEATPVFNDLYGNINTLQQQTNSKVVSEQALQLEFVNMSSGAVVTTKRQFSRAVDISQHRHFNFLLFGNADTNNINASGNKVFFLRAGNDTNFFEVQVPLNFTGWRKIVVEQQAHNKNSIADRWKAKSAGTVVISSGSPSLQQVADIVAGVRSLDVTAGQTTRGRLYLNEIYLSDPITRIGTASKIEATFDIPGWTTFGAKYRYIDRGFQTPTSVVSNQDNESDSAFLNFTRLTYLPLTFNLSRAVTETPNTNLTGSLSNIVNLLQTGKVTTWNGTASGNFNYGQLPRLNFGHSRNRTEYDLLTRLDDRKAYNVSLSYSVPRNYRVLPKTIDSNYSYSRYNVTFNSPVVRKLPGSINTEELSQNYGLRLTFIPWTGSSFNPTYSLTRTSEKSSDFTGPEEINLKYPKSLTQSTGFNSNLRLNRWLNPQFNYSIDTIENNILNVSTFIVGITTYVFRPGDIKTINRSANGSVNLPLVIAEIFPRTRLFHSVNIASGYQIQDGDVWNNVEEQMRSENKLWIRSPLRPRNPVAQRASQTLRDTYNSTQRWSPMEAYNIRGRLGAFKTLSLSNNYVKSIQRNDVTGTLSKTITTTFPDAVASISQLEKLWFAERWMASTQMNFKYSAHKTENVGETIAEDESFGTDLRTIIMKKFDSLLSYNNRASQSRDVRLKQITQTTSHEDGTAQVTFDYTKFRYTTKVDYSNDKATQGTGVETQNLTVITPSLLVRADLMLPGGIRLPGSSKTFMFTNRIIWTTTTSLAIRKSPITIADNSKLFSFNTSADYEIAKNLRMTLNGAMSRLWHKFLKEEEFVSYQMGSTLTFQF